MFSLSFQRDALFLRKCPLEPLRISFIRLFQEHLIGLRFKLLASFSWEAFPRGYRSRTCRPMSFSSSS